MKKFISFLNLIVLGLYIKAADNSSKRGLDNGKTIEARQQDYLENFPTHALDDACDAIFDNPTFQNNDELILDRAFEKATQDSDDTEQNLSKDDIEVISHLLKKEDAKLRYLESANFIKFYQLCMQRRGINQNRRQVMQQFEQMKKAQKKDKGCLIS